MNLATATITILFSGIVHFYDPGGSALTREVVMPRTPRDVKHGGIKLAEHHALVVIQGLKGDEAARRRTCETTLGGKYDDVPAIPVCTVVVEGKIITLPVATTSLDVQDSFKNQVPSLKGLCAGLGQIKREYLDDPATYAGRVTLTTGTLDACRNGRARKARLRIVTDTPVLKIGNAFAELVDKAVVTMTTTPKVESRDQSAHFMWHYKMYNDPVYCVLPKAADESLSDCGAGAATHVHPGFAGTGLGCTPTTP